VIAPSPSCWSAAITVLPSRSLHLLAGDRVVLDHLLRERRTLSPDTFSSASWLDSILNISEEPAPAAKASSMPDLMEKVTQTASMVSS
jgi:hypothetical protein